jgi:hypothetical protein
MQCLYSNRRYNTASGESVLRTVEYLRQRYSPARIRLSQNIYGGRRSACQSGIVGARTNKRDANLISDTLTNVFDLKWNISQRPALPVRTPSIDREWFQDHQMSSLNRFKICHLSLHRPPLSIRNEIQFDGEPRNDNSCQGGSRGIRFLDDCPQPTPTSSGYQADAWNFIR